MSLFLLFLAAFGAATLLPLQSEAVLLGLLWQGSYSAALLIMIASAGNILGSCVNWYLGFKIEQYKHKKWFPVSEQQMLKAKYLSEIRLLVIIAELGADYWRSNYINCRFA